MTDLSREIAEARAAAEEVAQQDLLREKAALLPVLEDQQERARLQEAAERHLDDTTRRVRGRLAAVAPRILAWRTALELVLVEGVELVEQLPALENEIAGAARELAAACRGVAEAAHSPDYYTDVYWVQARLQGGEIPDELTGASPGLNRLWREVGGMDPALDAFADGLDELLQSDVGKVLRKAIERRTFVYTPQRGDWFVSRF